MTRTTLQGEDPNATAKSGSRVDSALSADFESGDSDVSVLELVNILLSHWRAVFLLPIALALLIAAVTLVLPPTYTATTAFVPEGSSQRRIPSSLAGLAGQFGLTLGDEGSQSPQFYAEVVRSRELMDRVLLTKFPDPRSGTGLTDSISLLRILRRDGRDLADSLNEGRKRLNREVSVRVDDRTGIVRLNVNSRYPELASSVANVFVAYLNEFNAQTRQSQARERRRFVEGRITAAQQDLQVAEDDLRNFYERNRRWQESPQLTLQEDRFRRQVQVRQELYLTLRREYETARIEEVNDTPVITIIDSAVPPQERSQRVLLVILALILGGIAGLFWTVSTEYLERARKSGNQEYNNFTHLLRAMQTDVSRFLRRRPANKT